MRSKPPGRVTASRQAMATEFRITIAHEDLPYAKQAAHAVLSDLDRLERRLSRYVPSSDISRIAALDKGQSAIVDPDTYDCLQLALKLELRTDGAFNVAYAMQPRRRAAALVRLLPVPPTIQVAETGVLLDLGGIGKGFALDRMAAQLQDWDIASALLQASASTVLARRPPSGAPGWAVRFGPKTSAVRLQLADGALSGSGRDVKGNHIVHPATGAPATRYRTAWAGAPTAAEADGLSTAFMVMSQRDIFDFCRKRSDVSAYILPTGESSVRVVYDAKRKDLR